MDPVYAKSNRNDLWAVWSLASQSAAGRVSTAVSVLIVWDGDKFFAQEKWQFLSYPKGLFTPFLMEQNNRFFTWFTPSAILGFTSPLPFWGGSVWFWKWRPSSKCTRDDVMLQGLFGRSPLQSWRQYRSNGTMISSLLKPKMTNGTPYGLVDLTGTVAALEDQLSISIWSNVLKSINLTDKKNSSLSLWKSVSLNLAKDLNLCCQDDLFG